MKPFRGLFVLILLSLCLSAWADGPEEEYVGIYGLIEQGDLFRESGDSAGAMARYSDAQNALARFSVTYPDWNKKIVSYRLNYLSEQISKLSYRPAAAAANPVPATNTSPAIIIPSLVAPPVAPGEAEARAAKIAEVNRQLQEQVSGLSEQVKGLMDSKTLLEAKLREAFSSTASTVAPGEMAKALDTIRTLQKENDLLKISLAQASSRAAKAVPPDDNAAKLQRQLSEAAARVEILSRSNLLLQNERQALLARIDSLSSTNTAVETLQAENQMLKDQLAGMKTRPRSNSAKVNEERKWEEAQAQLAVLRSEKEMLRYEKIALEQKLRQFMPPAPQAAAPTAGSPPVTPVVPVTSKPADAAVNESFYQSKIASLESQRDQLQKSLDAAAEDVSGKKKGKTLAARLDEMSREMAGLRATIDVLESKPVPYSPDELAVMSQPPASDMIAVHKPRAERGHSTKAALLLTQARNLYVAHDNVRAEETFKQALGLEPGNFEILADLGSVQLDLGKVDEAEKSVNLALKDEPQDYFSLYVLGQIKFAQKKYDEALDVLGKAAKITPQDANIENFIGLTLSEKGLRAQAETAFRTAIQWEPDYAEAHMNLAVVYATQTPPLVELARWHYEKAVKIGHERKPKLEELINAAAKGADGK